MFGCMKNIFNRCSVFNIIQLLTSFSVDMRIFLPESDIHLGCKAKVNITFKGR